MMTAVNKRQRAAIVAWLRLDVAAEEHADALVASFETRDRWPLKEGYKLLHRWNVRNAILAWAKDRCSEINGAGPKTLSGKIIHPPPLDDEGNLVLPDEHDLEPFLEPYVYGALRQDLLAARALTIDGLAKGERPHRIASGCWQDLVPDFKQSRASIDGKDVLFRVEVERAASAINRKAPAAYSQQKVERWYRDEYVGEMMRLGKSPNEKQDHQAAKLHFRIELSRKAIRLARRNCAPPEWKRKGPKLKPARPAD
jgi:hypothetical protein